MNKSATVAEQPVLLFGQEKRPQIACRDKIPAQPSNRIATEEDALWGAENAPRRHTPEAGERIYHALKGWAGLDHVQCWNVCNQAAAYPEEHSIGVLLGNGLLAFDIDIEDKELCACLQDIFEAQSGEFIAKTGSKGFTVFCCVDESFVEDLPNILKLDGQQCVDILYNGRQTVVHGTHAKGMPYRWISDFGLAEVEVEDLIQFTPELFSTIKEAIGLHGVVGGSAALFFGVPQDYGLIVAMLLALGIVVGNALNLNITKHKIHRSV